MRFWVTTKMVLGQGPTAEFSARKGPTRAFARDVRPWGEVSQLQDPARSLPCGEEPPQQSFWLPADSLEQSPASLHLQFPLCSETVYFCSHLTLALLRNHSG